MTTYSSFSLWLQAPMSNFHHAFIFPSYRPIFNHLAAKWFCVFNDYVEALHVFLVYRFTKSCLETYPDEHTSPLMQGQVPGCNISFISELDAAHLSPFFANDLQVPYFFKKRREQHVPALQ